MPTKTRTTTKRKTAKAKPSRTKAAATNGAKKQADKSLSALDAAMPEEFARTMFRYMPNVLAALLILVLGSLLARFLARSVLIGTVNLQLPAARLLGLGVKWLVLIVAWAMALDHLGIGRKSFSDAQLRENLFAFVDALQRAKPSGAKGIYLRTLSITSTMAPGIHLDVPVTVAAAADAAA